MSDRGSIPRLPSGVPGLDEVLGGGIPELSFNLIAGRPGCGKTTLAHQILFANATPQRRALYIMVLGEPPLKMLRYQQQFSFFDESKLTSAVRFLHLGIEMLSEGTEKVLERIVAEVDKENIGIVMVDSFRSVVRRTLARPKGEEYLPSLIQRLAQHLTSYQATTFLIDRFQDDDGDSHPVFTMADGILWLYQSGDHNSMVRKLRVVKMRGQGQIPGLHTARISQSGLSIFPRV